MLVYDYEDLGPVDFCRNKIEQPIMKSLNMVNWMPKYIKKHMNHIIIVQNALK